MDDQKYGTLVQPAALLHRQYFREMVKLLGIRVIYRYPLPGKHYTTYADIDANFSQPILTGCIFDEHPTQKTMKKMGWIAELEPSKSVIHVDYDLPNLQRGGLFIIPSGIDNAKARIFRIDEMTSGFVYPTSVACIIAPEYENEFNEQSSYDFSDKSFTIIDYDNGIPNA